MVYTSVGFVSVPHGSVSRAIKNDEWHKILKLNDRLQSTVLTLEWSKTSFP